MENTAFDDLLFKAEQLTAEIDGNSDLPRVERNLKQLFEAGQELWSRTAFHRQRETSDVRASVLLGSKGYDLQKVSQALESLNTTKKIAAVESTKESDIQGLLRHERESAIISVIEEVKNSTFETVDKKCWGSMEKEWEDYKLKMLNSLVGDSQVVDMTISTPRKPAETSSLYRLDSQQEMRAAEDRLSTSKISQEKDVENLINQISVGASNPALFESGLRLLLESRDSKPLMLLNKHLSVVASEKRGSSQKRDQLEALALKLAETYSQGEHNIDKEAVGTLYLLLDLMTFFDYYHNGTHNDALDILIKLKILPFRSSEVQQKVVEFGQYSVEIRRNIPDVLIAAMNILFSQYKNIKNSASQTVTKFGVISDSSSKEQLCSEIRSKAKSLITYAGMIPYRMPGDTNARLVQLEVLMN